MRSRLPSALPAVRERAAIVGLAMGSSRRADAEASLDELAGLVAAAGAMVAVEVLQERARPDAALFLGRGKINELAAACNEAKVDLVVFDNELSPGQLKNLEGVIERRVIDRTQLILDIFASRARTREGKLQVELAQLEYLLPRLAGAAPSLSRLGGGIGTRGPGETKLETDRRRIRDRIATLTRQLRAVRQRRTQLRERRHRAAAPTVALVGYTNAGKTTLFNRLTGSAALASRAMFATLDPLVRQVELPDRRTLLVSDTVGFIDRLPHTLVAAFRATLEEVAHADLLLHVIDASSPELSRRSEAVMRVLGEVGAAAIPMIEVLNKWDVVDAPGRARLETWYPDAVCVSALTGEGRDRLVGAMLQRLEMRTRQVVFEFDASAETDRRQIARIYRMGHVLRHVTTDGRVSITAELPERTLARWGSAAN